MEHVYFIEYKWWIDDLGISGCGNCEYVHDGAITNIKHVNAIEKSLTEMDLTFADGSKKHNSRAHVRNFILLRKNNSGGIVHA